LGDIIDGPLVRIIIPAFERASLFEVSLLSAINQTYRNIEVIVLDNSESDAVYEVAKKYQN